MFSYGEDKEQVSSNDAAGGENHSQDKDEDVVEESSVTLNWDEDDVAVNKIAAGPTSESDSDTETESDSDSDVEEAEWSPLCTPTRHPPTSSNIAHSRLHLELLASTPEPKDEDKITSISHPGTRKQSRHRRSQQHRRPVTHSNPAPHSLPRTTPISLPKKRELTPDLTNVTPINKRRRTTQWDIKPASHDETPPEPDHHSNSYSSDSAQTVNSGLLLSNYHTTPLSPSIPTGPKAYMDTRDQICFFWYHQGRCSRHKGRGCDYVHGKGSGKEEVGLPYYVSVGKHDPDCQLPLCPIRIRREETRKEKEGAYFDALNRDVDRDRSKPDVNVNARGLVSSQSAKVSNVEREMPRPSRGDENGKERDVPAMEKGKGKGKSSNLSTFENPQAQSIKQEPASFTQDVRFSGNRHPDRTSLSKRMIRKLEYSVERRVMDRKRKVSFSLPDHYTGRGKRAKTHYSSPPPPISKQDKNKGKKKKRGKRGNRGNNKRDAEGGEDWYLNGFPTNSDPGTKMANKAPRTTGQEDETIRVRRSRVLVEYELSEGEQRAEWDTDFLRRAFGEIE